ncbi:MAG: GNAT family N-acetyltransferase [Thermoleophilaceae bacterium]|nr:GNAT family N-acetyltransferase [Thermoleophilaceae bacterium]
MPAVDYSVSELDAADVDRLRDPALALHRHEIGVQPDLAGAPARPDDAYWELYRSRFAEWMADSKGFCFVAEGTDGAVLGFVFCVEREGLAAYESGPAIGYVEEIAVVESARELGIGRALMEAARLRFRERGYAWFELSTVPGNEDARAFYARLGMQPAAVLMLGEV